ncbi:glycerol kinase GlpK [Sporichthya brevicatena]|uniref:ATP:glycerol 3-phosphotransferase n=1 Tax=Sporichthya brevicatena TaxID=171442 RepID=A0ABP3RVY1_9ACTN
MAVLAIDAGTTGVTALVVTPDGRVAARGYAEFPQHFPSPGQVEHVPEEIWQATLRACRDALDAAAAAGVDPVVCVGITNQRETAVLWDRKRLRSPRPAIVWQDRRTTAICDRLKEAGHEPRVAELTGLRLDPYFTGTKLTWLTEHDTRTWDGVRDGSLAIGTVDSYLIARLTGGQVHATDASNASRTLLYDIGAGAWSDELCELLGVPRGALPEVVPSFGEIGRTDPEEFLGLDVPISGIAGDQQAALFGQACYSPGDSKCTYGTGSFLLINTGSDLVRSDAGLLTTVAWQDPDGSLTYALEGAIFVTGAAVQWLRDGLGIISSASETTAVAGTVPDSGGVVFVPALTGLGAPHWDPDARGTIVGITRGTTRAHLVRATLEAITYEVRDVIEVMTAAAGLEVPVLTVDGGAAANDLLCQLQSTELGVPVQRPEILETTGLGAAFLAGLGAGVWSTREELARTWRLDRRFEPGPRDDAGYARWLEAVRRARGWATATA